MKNPKFLKSIPRELLEQVSGGLPHEYLLVQCTDNNGFPLFMSYFWQPIIINWVPIQGGPFNGIPLQAGLSRVPLFRDYHRNNTTLDVPTEPVLFSRNSSDRTSPDYYCAMYSLPEEGIGSFYSSSVTSNELLAMLRDHRSDACRPIDSINLHCITDNSLSDSFNLEKINRYVDNRLFRSVI